VTETGLAAVQVMEAVGAALREAEAEANGTSIDRSLMLFDEVGSVGADLEFSRTARSPATIAEAHRQLNDAVGSGVNENAGHLSARSTASSAGGASRTSCGGSLPRQLASREVLEASSECQWELGPALRLCLALLITRLRELRSAGSAKAVELLRAEAAASAAEAMCAAITRRRAASEAEVLHLQTEYERALEVNHMEDVETFALDLQQRAKAQAGLAAGAVATQMARLDDERRVVSATMAAEAEALAALRAALQSRWAEVQASQRDYAAVRTAYQERIAAIFSGHNEGVYNVELSSSSLTASSSGREAGCPDIADALKGLLSSSAEAEVPLSLERQAPPMALPDRQEASAATIMDISRLRSPESTESPTPTPTRQLQTSSPQFVSGSSVLIGHSAATTAAEDEPSLELRHFSHTAQSTGALPAPPLLRASVDSSTLPSELPKQPQAAWEYPHATMRQSRANNGTGLPRRHAAPPAIAIASPAPYNPRKQKVKAPSGMPLKTKPKGAAARASMKKAPKAGGAASQWELVRVMLSGRALYLVSEQHLQPSAVRRSTVDMSASTARDGNKGAPSVVVLSLSNDYSRLVMRRAGVHVSSFLRVADLQEVTPGGTRALAVSAASLRASIEEARSGVNPDADVVLELPLLSLTLHDRQLTLAARDASEAKTWLDGLTLLVANRDRLPRLKTDLAAFQYPGLFKNSRGARP
jgi:hypothetical protein